MRGRLLIIFLTCLLSACMPVRNIPPPAVLPLDPLETIQQPAATSAESVTVVLPSTAPELDTFRVALKKSKIDWDYYAGVKWPDFLPIVVREDVAKTVERAHIFKSVMTDESPAPGNKMLKIDIQSFYAAYARGSVAPVIKIRMVVSLADRLRKTPLASFTINVEKKASGNSLSAIQAAFTAAFSDAQRQIVKKLKETLSGRL